ncbi:N-fatty-acyl-amino acid synthase/hydrolase PM20D1.2 isoform X2 [Cynoglossus semilaevis]|uniref:N-fatty-acyl-amino acid synthase/hydrolase PM20D1.2 isoform X2 n=1 Tax=Cynoglossus semilaevis TaxID=244447 RepID=UPI000D624B60|nr:N-fatty-acyl-amino acid synthase/hydrolase PM20D1 isoform X2 [Cynoglossus semilaevis]
MVPPIQQLFDKADSGSKFKMQKFLRIVGYSVLFSTTTLFILLCVRTLSLDKNVGLQLAHWEKTKNISLAIDHELRDELLDNLKEGIRIPTVSFTEDDINTTALLEFNAFLQKAFPTVYSSKLVRHELVANYSHLFWVEGSDPNLIPYLLLAHIDVVPASESDDWDVPPFSAQEVDGFIYGRGTLDDKSSVMGILQALEFLLRKGYTPRRGFYIGLGHDEEVKGNQGAVSIVNWMKQRGKQLLFVLDEGMLITDSLPIDGPAALIGITEKGSATVKLSVSVPPGHSSMPQRETCIGILASAVSRIEANQMPRLFGYGPELRTFEHLAHKFSFPMNILMSNLWLFSPLIGRVLEKQPHTNSFVRTTTAVTMFNAGIKVVFIEYQVQRSKKTKQTQGCIKIKMYPSYNLKVNVIPSHAEAVVNMRIHSAHSLKEVLDHIESTVADERVKLELIEGFEPLPVSSTDEKSFGFQIIKKTVLEQFPSVTVAPGVCVGNTDSRHFNDLTSEIYRFIPAWLHSGDFLRIHGNNERISKQNYEEYVMFYSSLIQNCDIQKLPELHSFDHDL